MNKLCAQSANIYNREGGEEEVVEETVLLTSMQNDDQNAS